MGLLTTPLRDRFGIPTRLQFYTDAELFEIVTRNARLLGAPSDEGGAREIARRARGTPRIAGRLLRRVVDFALIEGDGRALVGGNFTDLQLNGSIVVGGNFAGIGVKIRPCPLGAQVDEIIKGGPAAKDGHLERGDQIIACCIATNGAQKGGFQTKFRQGDGNVQRHAAGQAGDAAGHIAAHGQRHMGAPDDVPQDRANAQNIRFLRVLCHAAFMPRPRRWSKGARPPFSARGLRR